MLQSKEKRIRTGVVAVAMVVGIGIGAIASGGTGAGAAVNQPPGLDHFLCYNASNVAGVPTFTIPAGVKLLNQFSARAFKPKVTALGLHCNPALKTVTTPLGQQTFPPLSPSWHLVCLNITARQRPNTHVVRVTNQFGTADLQTGPPTQLCLPSLKSLQTPPVFSPLATEIQPDHFTCYPVSYMAGTTPFAPPGAVSVGDQFDNFAPTPVQIGAPTTLCVPTQKKIKKVITPITNGPAHLLCFGVTPTPTFTGVVWDRNQFGTGGLSVQNTASLCLPSFKQLIK